MQKFCNQCGRLLREGEICVCRQGAADRYAGASAGGISRSYANVRGQGMHGDYTGVPNQGLPGEYASVSNERMSNGYSNMPGQGASGNYTDASVRRMSGDYTVSASNQRVPDGYTYMSRQGVPGYRDARGQTGASSYGGQQRNSSYQFSGVTSQAQFNRTRVQFVNETKNVFAKILPVLRNPVEETSRIASTGDSTLGMQMIIFNIGVTAILLLLSMATIRSKLGDYAEWIDIPYAKIIVSITGIVAAVYFATAGLLLMASKMFFQAETSFAEIISITGTKALLDALVSVGGALLVVISPQAGLIFLIIGNVISILVFLFSYAESVELEGSKKVYSLLITYAGLFLMSYFLCKLFLNDILSSFEGLGGLF